MTVFLNWVLWYSAGSSNLPPMNDRLPEVEALSREQQTNVAALRHSCGAKPGDTAYAGMGLNSLMDRR